MAEDTTAAEDITAAEDTTVAGDTAVEDRTATITLAAVAIMGVRAFVGASLKPAVASFFSIITTLGRDPLIDDKHHTALKCHVRKRDTMQLVV